MHCILFARWLALPNPNARRPASTAKIIRTINNSILVKAWVS